MVQSSQQFLVNNSTAQHCVAQRSMQEAHHRIITGCTQPMVAKQAKACQAYNQCRQTGLEEAAVQADQAALLVKD